MPYVFVATPMYGGMCHGTYTASIARMAPVFMNAQVPVQMAQTREESLVTKARDGLAYDFLQTDCTHLMFVDADIGFLAEDILSMIAADKDIIGGLYPLKTICWEQVVDAVQRGVPAQELHEHVSRFAAYTLGGEDIMTRPAGDQPVEVAYIAAGFMLIKREVLEGLADQVPGYDSGRYLMRSDCPHRTRQARRLPAECHQTMVWKQYFDTSIDPDDNDLLLTEDYHFCKLARDHGYRVWAAPWVKLSHTGAYQFGRQWEAQHFS